MSNDIDFDRIATPLGTMLLASDGSALVGAWFDGQRHQPALGPKWRQRADSPILRRAAALLARYFAGERVSFDVPLAPEGTAFQREVWTAIAGVPYGGTIAYRELAAKVGRPQASRAVGAATGRNPLTIFVPCHRIVGAAGELTGYAGGIGRKRSLLELERTSVAAATVRRAA